MAVLVPSTALADEVAVAGASATFPTLNMVITKQPGLALYQLCANTDIWYSQGVTPTATAGPASVFLAKGVIAILDGSLGAKVAVIQDSAAGKASLCPALRFA